MFPWEARRGAADIKVRACVALTRAKGYTGSRCVCTRPARRRRAGRVNLMRIDGRISG